jgi:hypothetical protein
MTILIVVRNVEDYKFELFVVSKKLTKSPDGSKFLPRS